MRNIFLLEELLLENRIDDVKKKYPNVPSEVIEEFASNDPSGTNKYLDWMVYTKSIGFPGIGTSNVIKNINLFHKNINKLTKEFFDEFIKENKFEWLLTDNSPVAKTFQNIYKSPKDINTYKDYGIASVIFKSVDNVLSKSEVKKLEANVLYNSDDLLIMIPKSHRASCYYGAGTKWCTTNKESDNYFKNYTNKGTLIYVINKKEPETNPWYKTAFLIEKENGKVQAYDAPDHPTDINIAAEKLGDNWGIIRDVIVEYLYKNELKGIENLYFGQDLIAWLESKDIDPLKTLNSNQLIEKLGHNTLISYLNKRGINIYEYLPYRQILEIYSIQKIWEGYKNIGINPLTKMFIKRNDADDLIQAIKNKTISLDEFLHLSSDPKFLESVSGGEVQGTKNIFTIMNLFFGSSRPDDWMSSRIAPALIELFNNDVDLIFGYAKNIGVNLFQALDVRGMNHLLNKKFDFENALKYTLQNKDYLKSTLVNYGFPKKEVIEYLSKQPNGIELFKELVDKDLIKDLRIEEVLPFFKDDRKEVFLFWLKSKFRGRFDVEDVLDAAGPEIGKVFSNIESFEAFISENYLHKDYDILKSVSIKSLWKSFFNKDFYQLYKTFLEKGRANELDTLMLIKAYEDAPVEEGTGLKNIVLERAHYELKGDNRCKLETRDGVDYIIFEDLDRVLGLFDDNADYYSVLSSSFNPDTYENFSDISYFLDNEITIKVIKDYLMDNFREKKVGLNLDWLEDFDDLGDRIKIDDINDKFYFKLYDELIQGMSGYNILVLVENSPELKKLKEVIESSYSIVYKDLLRKELKDELTSKMEGIFGDDFMRTKKIQNKYKEPKTVYEFRYDYLMDDIITFADDFVFYEEELPNSVYDLIVSLMENNKGRFDGTVSLDLEYVMEIWSPYENQELFLETFTNELYQTLSKSED
jgi:hypothetical protein